MQDRFKFRLFDKETGEMIYKFTIDSEGSFADVYGDKKLFDLQQCTGIKDVKGNLIYEGDILKLVNGSINGIGLSDKWEVKWIGDGWNISQWSFDSTHSYEIIGNIYQNKELLKEQKC